VHEVHRPVEGGRLRGRLRRRGHALEHVKSAGGEMLRLVESPEPNERVGQPEMAGDRLERASRQLSGTDGPIGCNPGGVGLVLPGESRRRGLVGTGRKA
jgi:hypothetical protein